MISDTEVQELMSLDESPVGEGSSLNMAVPRQALLVRRALQDEKTNLSKLADKVDDAGYAREARVMRGDAETIAEDLLPQLEAQREIPLATADEVKHGIMARIRRAIRPFMREARAGEDDPEAKCLEEVATKVEAFATEIAGRAYRAGVTARAHEPESIALASLEALGTG